MNYQEEYGRLHRNPKYFRGTSLLPHVETIGELIQRFGAKTLLDYGCGKGEQYTKHNAHGSWGVMPTLYDIGVPELRHRPSGKFDGVICTDVLEHVEERDLPLVLGDIFGYSKKFVFLAISCVLAADKAGKRLSDGRNLHVTVKPPEWWNEKLKPYGGFCVVAYV